jgi:hypothetical protein
VASEILREGFRRRRRYTGQRTEAAETMIPKDTSMDGHGEAHSDERLHALLHEWKGVEPRANLEAAVWRSLRTAAVPVPRGLAFILAVRDWILPPPVWAGALSATAAILVGVFAGVSTSAGRDSRVAAEPLLHARTLAGSYLAMVTGGAR